eukprot:gene10384-biopygen3290
MDGHGDRVDEGGGNAQRGKMLSIWCCIYHQELRRLDVLLILAPNQREWCK